MLCVCKQVRGEGWWLVCWLPDTHAVGGRQLDCTDLPTMRLHTQITHTRTNTTQHYTTRHCHTRPPTCAITGKK